MYLKWDISEEKMQAKKLIFLGTLIGYNPHQSPPTQLPAQVIFQPLLLRNLWQFPIILTSLYKASSLNKWCSSLDSLLLLLTL